MFIKIGIGIVSYILMIYLIIFITVKMLNFLSKSFVGVSLSEVCNRLVKGETLEKETPKENNSIYKTRRFAFEYYSGERLQVNAKSLEEAIDNLPNKVDIKSAQVIGEIDDRINGLKLYDKPQVLFNNKRRNDFILKDCINIDLFKDGLGKVIKNTEDTPINESYTFYSYNPTKYEDEFYFHNPTKYNLLQIEDRNGEIYTYQSEEKAIQQKEKLESQGYTVKIYWDWTFENYKVKVIESSKLKQIIYHDEYSAIKTLKYFRELGYYAEMKNGDVLGEFIVITNWE